MHVVFTTPTRTEDLEVVVHDGDATVADLCTALAVATTGLAVDGRRLAPDRPLRTAGITDGSELSAHGAGAHAEAGEPLAVVRVVGGVDAGLTVGLAVGPATVGRGPGPVRLEDPTVSVDHARVEVDEDGGLSLRDLGSRNGTWIGDRPVTKVERIGRHELVRIGATHLSFGPPPPDDRPAGTAPMAQSSTRSSTRPFNRPPRANPLAPPAPLDAPEPPVAPPDASPIGLVAVIAPVVIGLVMVKVLGSLLFGLFALLSPVLLVGSSVEARRRRTRGRRRDRSRFAAELERFVVAARVLAQAERDRRAEVAPDPAEVARRAMAPSTRLWERRPDHPDFLHVRLGTATHPWPVPLRTERRAVAAEVLAALAPLEVLHDVAVGCSLAGGVVGIVGDRSAALAVARSLVLQTATHQGPADLTLAIVTAPAHAAAWDWAKWLPHTIDPMRPGHRRLATGRTGADELLRELGGWLSPGHDGAGPATTLLVVDDGDVTAHRRSITRSLFGGRSGPVSGIVLASTEDRLPAACTVVVDVSRDAIATVLRIHDGTRTDGVLLAGMGEATVRSAARKLAGWDDAEVGPSRAALPARVDLLPLLDLPAPSAERLAARWAEGGVDPPLVAPLGVGADGPLVVDLVADGPHALVAGTTGAGKSELLRTLVAGLAAACSPDHVTFVLIDFKGGSAFDQCAELPHTVGLVTDLDPHLAARALRCLEAELRHRERRLRAAGASDLTAFRRLPAGPATAEPLPRLVIVIDEFATLKAEVPDFVDALVGVAQRGRSLGVHLVLATQRPSGAVSESIRANTNLRIALRVQDGADSTDVIDGPEAASIGRELPGRALVRLGPGEVVPLQAALVTGTTAGSARPAVEVRPFRFGRGPSAADPARTATATPDASTTDLTHLVRAAAAAHAERGGAPPRAPWPDPLPTTLTLDGLLAPGDADLVVCALADEPDDQRQRPTGWDPTAGNLLLFGIAGSGTSTACAAIALALAAASPPDDLHLQVLDLGARDLDALRGLPHVGSVVAAGETERQARLVGRLVDELARRRFHGTSEDTARPRIVVLLDGMAAFRSQWEDGVSGLVEQVLELFAAGPAVGIHMVVTADRAGAIPAAMQSLAHQRWVFRLADPQDLASFGLHPVPGAGHPPGRAVDAETGTELQVAHDPRGLRAAVTDLAARWPAPRRPPEVVGELPRDLQTEVIGSALRCEAGGWFLPVGIGSRDLAVTGLVLHDGEHALVAGPSRSGRSTALLGLARSVRAGWPAATIVGIATARSPLRRSPDLDRAVDPADLSSLRDLPPGGATLVLVDDAERVDDGGGHLATLLAEDSPGRHVVAAGHNDSLRGLYAHWTRALRRSRTAILLDPDLDLDGDLAGVTLPRRSTVPMAPGRGYLVAAGTVDLVQLAQPWSAPASGSRFGRSGQEEC